MQHDNFRKLEMCLLQTLALLRGHHTRNKKHFSKTFSILYMVKSKNSVFKVSKGAKIRNRYDQVPHVTMDKNGKVTNSKLDTTSESQKVSPFPAGDHKAHTNRRAQRHSKRNTEKKTHTQDPQKKHRPRTVIYILLEG